jgi:hypothetical protein
VYRGQRVPPGDVFAYVPDNAGFGAGGVEHSPSLTSRALACHPLLAYCDNTGEPLAGTLRKGSAGSNTVADHLAVLEAAIAVLVTCVRGRGQPRADHPAG